MNTLSQPIVFVPILGIVFAALAYLAARKTRGPGRGLLNATVAACLLFPAWLLVSLLAPQWIDARYRVYKAFYDDIEAGMTRDQVIATLDNRYPEGGPRKRPTIMKDTAEELGFHMNPEHSREPNCEGIFVDLADGLVTRKHYSRD